MGFGLTRKHLTRLEKTCQGQNALASLLRKSVNYVHKKFYNIVPRCDTKADEILSYLDKVFYYYDIPDEFTNEEKMDQLFNSDQVIS
jgi:hypothetical protein